MVRRPSACPQVSSASPDRPHPAPACGLPVTPHRTRSPPRHSSPPSPASHLLPILPAPTAPPPPISFPARLTRSLHRTPPCPPRVVARSPTSRRPAYPFFTSAASPSPGPAAPPTYLTGPARAVTRSCAGCCPTSHLPPRWKPHRPTTTRLAKQCRLTEIGPAITSVS